MGPLVDKGLWIELNILKLIEHIEHISVPK